MKKCYYIEDPDHGNILIPGCIGAAVYGIDRCTCRESYPPKITKKVVYIAHPIGGDVESNLLHLKGIIAFINRNIKGVIPFAPYYADVVALDDSNPKDRRKGISNNKHFFYSGTIDEVWLFGSNISKGMQQEIEFAKQNFIPVINKQTEDYNG